VKQNNFPIDFDWVSDLGAETENSIDLFWRAGDERVPLSRHESPTLFLTNLCRAAFYQTYFQHGGRFTLENEDSVINVASSNAGKIVLEYGNSRKIKGYETVDTRTFGDFILALMAEVYNHNDGDYHSLVLNASFNIFPENEAFVEELGLR
jgi:hypothetical protein